MVFGFAAGCMGNTIYFLFAGTQKIRLITFVYFVRGNNIYLLLYFFSQVGNCLSILQLTIHKATVRRPIFVCDRENKR
jgi:hypothetical protein